MHTPALAIFSTLMLLTFSAVAAPVYECTNARGQRSYSQTPAKNCRAANLSSAGFYTAAPAPTTAPVSSSYAAPDNNITPGSQAAAVDNSQIQAAQQRLNEARRALDDGRKVRYGNERNYAKYLERIAGLEAAVRQSEQALQQLQAGGAAALH
ncbi:DUF4124 domain-containing protein [Paralysiella testudinis]|uniref:DUF4124 domain-containing protein n=1 Tax=Paralysiella testudinis TaxID=2809020 RepID=A0A892ZJI2_9NEIS|nr:DUF4124 domain-containing protein [Paralysiella testudinis]QRQ81704.1 DUF4124 domain-containing protein [Paralysiella testudinis]